MDKRVDTTEFAKTVEEHWRRMNLSHGNLAAEIGVTASSVNGWEDKCVHPSPQGSERPPDGGER